MSWETLPQEASWWGSSYLGNFLCGGGPCLESLMSGEILVRHYSTWVAPCLRRSCLKEHAPLRLPYVIQCPDSIPSWLPHGDFLVIIVWIACQEVGQINQLPPCVVPAPVAPELGRLKQGKPLSLGIQGLPRSFFHTLGSKQSSKKITSYQLTQKPKLLGPGVGSVSG